MKTYIQFFDTRDDAWVHMIDQNRTRAPADRQPGAESFTLYCPVDEKPSPGCSNFRN